MPLNQESHRVELSPHGFGDVGSRVRQYDIIHKRGVVGTGQVVVRDKAKVRGVVDASPAFDERASAKGRIQSVWIAYIHTVGALLRMPFIYRDWQGHNLSS